MQLVSRISAILRALENQPVGLSLGQIAKATGLPRPTVHRILVALEVEQFVGPDPVNGGVRLGGALTRLAASAHSDFKSTARPLLETLCRRVQETVVLTAMRHGRITVIDLVTPDRPLQMVIPVGVEVPPLITASGKAHLAALPPEELGALVPGAFAIPTSETPITREAFLEELEAVRRSGIAQDIEEVSEGVCALAATVRDPLDTVYAVCISAPSVRFYKNEVQFREELAETAARLQRHCI